MKKEKQTANEEFNLNSIINIIERYACNNELEKLKEGI